MTPSNKSTIRPMRLSIVALVLISAFVAWAIPTPLQARLQKSDKETKKAISKKMKRGKTMKDTKTVFDFTAKSIDGKEIDLSDYRGKVLLIVNTASKCGFTPQYTGLQKLHEEYKDKGLVILGFPCNQFGSQEPGGESEISNFCQKNYGVDFQMFEKVDVNGKDAHPLYKYLTHHAPGALNTESIKWNFTKFLIDKEGNSIKRYASSVTPKDLEPEIEKLL